MKVLITGADGLLGSHVTRLLIKQGYSVIALVLKGTVYPTISALNITIIEGDILDYENLKEQIPQVDIIIHLAANTSVFPYRSSIVKKVNIDGTLNMMQLARVLNVKKLIYCGTANSFSYGTKQNPGIEDTPYLSVKYGLDYMDSKAKAQELVLEAAKDGLPALVVNPTFMFGKYDSKPSSGALIVATYNNQIPAYASGGKNYICAKDAAHGVVNAIEMGRIGECYILGNDNLTYKEAFKKIGKTINVKPPKWEVPSWLILIYGRFDSFIARITNKKPKVGRALSRISCDGHYYSSDKAIKELKLPQSPIEEGITECFEWLLKQRAI
ncbi:NAD-dependent epimerase/dehydratase family protein [Bacteroidia bacterium]|nr:NAD-dependent epimerase/dehydratase family protein [Bacteroidia bacterium]MDB4107208.1 NAD-dependent epimerase/dehydratase family protein [Bacteroidia bacterium]MDB9881876.1 NAD-dependent epimerase/dehydratase family protein [Bacteroidia bacterium]